ncbi:MAG: hypothetical protein HY766_11270 [candidate division NC10 bacterium]|nr:hypothetical protein [candidate division NC10 bacterium]MBI4839527.1 hypothetical protein [candidate division NC10 bacterium]
MTGAVTGAALIGQWEEGAAVAFLYAVSNLLEATTLDRARRTIRGLMDLAPREGRTRRSTGSSTSWSRHRSRSCRPLPTPPGRGS